MTVSPLSLVPEPAPDALDVALSFGRDLDADPSVVVWGSVVDDLRLPALGSLQVIADPSGSPVARLADVVRVLAVESAPVAPGRTLVRVERLDDGARFGLFADRLEPSPLSFEEHVRTALEVVR